jgi:hypothetical protein
LNYLLRWSGAGPDRAPNKDISMRNDVKAKVIQVIEVEHIRGGSAENEPLRPVKTYWDLKGAFLAEYDPMLELMTDSYGKKTESMESPI